MRQHYPLLHREVNSGQSQANVVSFDWVRRAKSAAQPLTGANGLDQT